MWPFRTRSSEQRSSIEDPRVPLSSPNIVAFLFGEGREDDGAAISVDEALTVPAMFAAVHFLASTFASLPVHHYRKNKNGDPEKPARSPIQRLLHDAPNPTWSSFLWRQWSMQQTLTKGRSVSFVERNAAGVVMNLWALNPDRITVKATVSAERVPTYVYEYRNADGKTDIYAAHEVIDVSFMLAADQVTAFSPVQKLRRAIALAIALEKYATRFFNAGGVPPLQLTGPFQSPAAAQRATFDVGSAIENARKEKRNIITLPTGHELKQIGFDPEKGQLEAARRFQLEEIARGYSMPPTFLQDLSRGTFSNSEQQDLHFVKHTLTQWVERWEQELTLKLCKPGEYIEFNVDGLLRGDFLTRMQGLATGIQNALITPNEGRAKDNRPAMPNGDKLMIQGATVPLGQQPTTTPPTEPPVPPADPAATEGDDDAETDPKP